MSFQMLQPLQRDSSERVEIRHFTPRPYLGWPSLHGSGLFTADLSTSEEYYLDVSIGTQQVYGRVVKITSDPLWIGLRSSERSQNPGSGDQPLFCQLTALRKHAIGQPLIQNGRVVCGPSGDNPAERSIELDQNKNRTDQPSFYVPLSWDDVKNLPSDRRNDFQGAPVSVEGYLSDKVVVQNRGAGESANCHLLGNEEVDWHIYLTKSPNEKPREAIIVETTPRVRPAHRWTPQMLTRYVASNTRVRISGWLMYDFLHVNLIGTLRATAWEVHPITKIEVQNDGQWVDLDNQP